MTSSVRSAGITQIEVIIGPGTRVRILQSDLSLADTAEPCRACARTTAIRSQARPAWYGATPASRRVPVKSAFLAGTRSGCLVPKARKTRLDQLWITQRREQKSAGGRTRAALRWRLRSRSHTHQVDGTWGGERGIQPGTANPQRDQMTRPIAAQTRTEITFPGISGFRVTA